MGVSDRCWIIGGTPYGHVFVIIQPKEGDITCFLKVISTNQIDAWGGVQSGIWWNHFAARLMISIRSWYLPTFQLVHERPKFLTTKFESVDWEEFDKVSKDTACFWLHAISKTIEITPYIDLLYLPGVADTNKLLVILR